MVAESLEGRRLLTGTWSTVAATPATGLQYGVVLTDGSIMVHGGSGGAATTWYKLSPSNGSYTAGTWSTLAPSNLGRLYTTTQVLTSGKVLTVGGEYASTNVADNNTGEVYDPVANTWTNTPNFPQSHYGDDPSALLPDGRVLMGYISGTQTYIYDPSANTYTQTGSKLRSDQSDEETWVTLPDHSILSYDVFSSISSGVNHAQRYIPSTGTWVDASNFPVGSALLTSPSVGYELGPGVLLPDGRVFYAGATNATAYYTPSTNTWAMGPNMPGGYVMADAPGAVLPNGNVLLAMSPLGTSGSSGYSFPSPTKIYEFNPTTNVFTDVTPALSGFNTNNPSYVFNMLVLPSGQVAVFNDGTRVAVYTEDGSPVAAAVPVISGITYSGTTGVYTLSGSNLNGINEGASYGDDNEMSSNYPLVRLTDSAGNINYARTSNWSNTGVFQGAETVTFTLPATATGGIYSLQAVANGVPSASVLAVLVNSSTTSNVTVQTDAIPSFVDVVGGNSLQATFRYSALSAIYIVGDNANDTINVYLDDNATGSPATVQAGSGTDLIYIGRTSSTTPVVIAPSAGNDQVNVGTAGAGIALARFLASQQLGMLNIGSGGTATVATGTKKLLQTSGLVITGTGSLDLTTNDMIVHSANAQAVFGLVASGFNAAGGGNWSGPGIRSSSAANDPTHLTALGAVYNGDGGPLLYGVGSTLGTFDGVNPVSTDMLVKYTYFGDANLDGRVDGSDYSKIDSGFNVHSTGWFNGDFDYSGSVDTSDYTLIDNAFNTQAARLPVAQAQATILRTVTGKIATPTSAGGLAGLTVYADLNHDGKYDAGDIATTTDAKGGFRFSGLPIGSSYWVRVAPRAGWSSFGKTGVLVKGGITASSLLFGEKRI